MEQRLREDARIGLLVNNAGAASGGFANPDLDALERLIQLNVTALTRLTGCRGAAASWRKAVVAIINLASVLAVAPEVMPGIYPATKAFVLTFSQSLQAELGPRGIYVQAVLPAATRTEIWQRSGMNIDGIPAMMDAAELVDAALVGFDRGETITIPPLPDVGQWDAFTAARQAMLPNFRQEHAAARYRTERARSREGAPHADSGCRRRCDRRLFRRTPAGGRPRGDLSGPPWASRTTRTQRTVAAQPAGRLHGDAPGRNRGYTATSRST